MQGQVMCGMCERMLKVYVLFEEVGNVYYMGILAVLMAL